MSTYEKENENEGKSPLENPVVRHGIGLWSAAILVVLAFVYFEGTIRWVLLGVAVLEVVVTPKIIGMAARGEEPDSFVDLLN